MKTRRRIPVAVLATVVVGLAACELEEVAIPSGEEVLIVHAIMRPDHPRQFVLIERSWRGRWYGGNRWSLMDALRTSLSKSSNRFSCELYRRCGQVPTMLVYGMGEPYPHRIPSRDPKGPGVSSTRSRV